MYFHFKIAEITTKKIIVGSEGLFTSQTSIFGSVCITKQKGLAPNQGKLQLKESKERDLEANLKVFIQKFFFRSTKCRNA